LACTPLIETGDIDDQPLMAAVADQVPVVTRLDRKSQRSALDGDEACRGAHLHADRRCRNVADVELDAEALMAGGDQVLGGVESGSLHEVDHHRRRQNADAAGADLRRGVLLADHQFGVAFEAWLELRQIGHGMSFRRLRCPPTAGRAKKPRKPPRSLLTTSCQYDNGNP